MTEFKVAGHESSILPDGNWKMCFSDELIHLIFRKEERIIHGDKMKYGLNDKIK